MSLKGRQRYAIYLCYFKAASLGFFIAGKSWSQESALNLGLAVPCQVPHPLIKSAALSWKCSVNYCCGT